MSKVGIVTPEKNTGKSLTIPVKTRTPLEAFQMLRAGQPVDQIGQIYHDGGRLEKDFFMLDKVEKLHRLAELREDSDYYQSQLQKMEQEIIANELKQKQDAEAAKAAEGTQGSVPK